jgi:hypothetical protein
MVIETPILAQINLYRQNLDQYEKEFDNAVQQQYPLSEVKHNELNQLKLTLNLNDDDVTAIESPIKAAIEEHLYKLQQYEETFLEAIKDEFPLTKETHQDLARFQQVLEISSEDVAKIEEKIISQSELSIFQKQETQTVIEVQLPKATSEQSPSTTSVSQNLPISPKKLFIWFLVSLGAILVFYLFFQLFFRVLPNGIGISQRQEARTKIERIDRKTELLSGEIPTGTIPLQQKIHQSSASSKVSLPPMVQPKEATSEPSTPIDTVTRNLPISPSSAPDTTSQSLSLNTLTITGTTPLKQETPQSSASSKASLPPIVQPPKVNSKPSTVIPKLPSSASSASAPISQSSLFNTLVIERLPILFKMEPYIFTLFIGFVASLGVIVVSFFFRNSGLLVGGIGGGCTLGFRYMLLGVFDSGYMRLSLGACLGVVMGVVLIVLSWWYAYLHSDQKEETDGFNVSVVVGVFAWGFLWVFLFSYLGLRLFLDWLVWIPPFIFITLNL